MYDKSVARDKAFNLLSQRAVCPSDMLQYLCTNGFIPDARFPEGALLESQPLPDEEATALVRDNWDFIARVYLQEFYRADL